MGEVKRSAGFLAPEPAARKFLASGGLLIVAIAVLGAAHILVRTSAYGAAVGWDSVTYLSAAESLAAGAERARIRLFHQVNGGVCQRSTRSRRRARESSGGAPAVRDSGEGVGRLRSSRQRSAAGLSGSPGGGTGRLGASETLGERRMRESGGRSEASALDGAMCGRRWGDRPGPIPSFGSEENRMAATRRRQKRRAARKPSSGRRTGGGCLVRDDGGGAAGREGRG